MEIQPVVHNTFTVERNYPAAPERVFLAFSDPARKRRWFAEGEHHTIEAYDLDFRDGGTEHYSSRFNEGTPVAGKALTNESIFQNRKVHLDLGGNGGARARGQGHQADPHLPERVS